MKLCRMYSYVYRAAVLSFAAVVASITQAYLIGLGSGDETSLQEA